MSESFTNLKGVYGGATEAGIKAAGGLDLSYIYIPEAAGSAAVFTKNHFCAAPVTYSKACFASGVVKAVVINAGNANACTGELGMKNTVATAQHAAELLGLSQNEVAIASTGIIGVQLPMPKVEAGLATLLKNKNKQDGTAVAKAILTTDLKAKTSFITRTIDGQEITVSGITKGSGMIAPNMATMLAFVVTDASIDSVTLQSLLSDSVSNSFNMITVDSDTSTNDVVMLFSTGEKKINLQSAAVREEFLTLLREACTDLAKQIVIDGEGAEKLITVSVSTAASEADARKVALSIANSPLVKTAIHGADPNWGRILMAAGKVPDVQLDQTKAALFVCGVEIVKNGMPLAFDRKSLSQQLSAQSVTIDLQLNVGSSSATAWGCDLTKGYIDINTAYS